MKSCEFVHLHMHTQYSLMDGLIRIEDVVAKAREFKMPALAITDHDNLFGTLDFCFAAINAGIKPIIGSEISLVTGLVFSESEDTANPPSHHLVLLCENDVGYRNLCSLVTIGSQQARDDGLPTIRKCDLEHHNKGLLCLSSCLDGEIASNILHGEERQVEETASWYKDVFSGGRYFFEIQENGLEGQRIVNSSLLRLSVRLGIPVVATNNCHYMRRSDSQSHHLLTCIRKGLKIECLDSNRITDQLYFKSQDQMAHDFRDIPESLTNTVAISERCSFGIKIGEQRIPRFHTGTAQTSKDFLEMHANQRLEHLFDRMKLRNQLEDGARQRYSNRLKREIHARQSNGLSDYILVTADIVRQARNQRVLPGPGKGSVPGSLVAFLMEITSIDPIRHNLVFERWLNPKRQMTPQIDVDLTDLGYLTAMEYVREKYGVGNVAGIISFEKIPVSELLEKIATAMGFTDHEIDGMAWIIANDLPTVSGLSGAWSQRFKERDAPINKVNDLILQLEFLAPLVIQVSHDTDGIIVSDEPLGRCMPLYFRDDGEILTQFNNTWLNRLGFVRFGFRRLDALNKIERTVRAVEKSRGIKLDLESIPLDDKPTFELLSSGANHGVFQVESEEISSILQRFKPSTFDDLVAILSLYRPGPYESGLMEEFVNRKLGLTPVDYLIPELKPILDETYGLIIYEEQVIQIATAIAGYSEAEGDLLRRALVRSNWPELGHEKSKFLDGARQNGIAHERASEIFELLRSSNGNTFSKAHSVAYALITYQTACLRMIS